MNPELFRKLTLNRILKPVHKLVDLNKKSQMITHEGMKYLILVEKLGREPK